jgi:hypothetical protein
MDVVQWVTNLDENNGRSDCKQPIELNKGLVFVLSIRTVKVELLDSLNSQFFVLKCNLVRIRCKLRRVLMNVFRESG